MSNNLIFLKSTSKDGANDQFNDPGYLNTPVY